MLLKCQPVMKYCKRRKFRGVINFVVFANATIPRNLILGGRYKPGELPVYSAILVLVSIIMQNVVLTADLAAYSHSRIPNLALGVWRTGHYH